MIKTVFFKSRIPILSVTEFFIKRRQSQRCRILFPKGFQVILQNAFPLSYWSYLSIDFESSPVKRYGIVVMNLSIFYSILFLLLFLYILL